MYKAKRIKKGEKRLKVLGLFILLTELYIIYFLFM